MQGNALVVASNAGTSATAAATLVVGGRYVLVLLATAYGATCYLQTLGPDGSTWINVNAAAYSANQVTAYDLPAGQYRMNLGVGNSALYATLVKIPY
jgi:hypothetical protein